MKVMFAIPAYRGIKCEKFIDAFEATTNHFKEIGIDFMCQILSGCCYVQVARNQLVKSFLDSDCDKIFFLDDDISWQPEDAVKIITSKYPVTAGIYRVKTDKEDYPVVLQCNEAGIPLANKDGWLLAPQVPTGFLCIDKEVFYKLQEQYPHLKYRDAVERGSTEWEEYFDYFPQGVKGDRWVGEDYAFCNLWTDMGGQIVAIPDITMSHHDVDKTYTGNLKEWLLKLPGGVNHEKG